MTRPVVSDLWKDIRPSGGPSTVHVRRADPSHPLDLFRGKDHEGNYIFSFTGRFPESAVVDLPKLAILEIALEHGNKGFSDLVIRLLDSSHIDIFRALCADLMAATEQLSLNDDSTGINIILERLRRWRELLRTLHDQRLSDAQIIGLFGELLLLRDSFLTHLQPLEAVAAWRGPHMDEQDFALHHWLIEVKTQLGSADSKLQISSENQLDSRSGQIFLCHQILGGAGRESAGARTLNSLVEEVAAHLSESAPAACDRFLAVLIEFGYKRGLPDYERDAWMLNERSYYRVSEKFPRITSADLRHGVQDVRYNIRLESCSPFAVSEADVTRQVFATHG